jgi:hypothetical protein
MSGSKGENVGGIANCTSGNKTATKGNDGVSTMFKWRNGVFYDAVMISLGGAQRKAVARPAAQPINREWENVRMTKLLVEYQYPAVFCVGFTWNPFHRGNNSNCSRCGEYAAIRGGVPQGRWGSPART